MRDLALENVPPVRARTTDPRQSPEERRGVDRLAHREEIHGVVLEVFVPVFDRAVLLDVRRALLRNLRHVTRLLHSTTSERRARAPWRMRRSTHLCELTAPQAATSTASSGRRPCCIANRLAVARVDASIFA